MRLVLKEFTIYQFALVLAPGFLAWLHCIVTMGDHGIGLSRVSAPPHIVLLVISEAAFTANHLTVTDWMCADPQCRVTQV